MLVKEKRQDPRVRRTRQLLVEAFHELIGKKGFQSVTVQDITERATVNRSTFYAHFEDKYDLFDYVIQESFQEALRAAMPEPAEFCLSDMKSLVLAVFEYLDQINSGCSTSEMQFRPMIETRVQAQLYELILAWLERLKPEDIEWSATPEVTAAVTSWAIYGTGLQWSRGGRGLPAEDVAEQTLSLISHGLYGTIEQNGRNN
jgi:AcrR family transcriptional regulator